MDENVNSNYVENAPILSPDGKTLFFSRQYHPDNIGGVEDSEDIWFCELDPVTGKWLPAKNLGAPLNTPGPNYISSIISNDQGTTLLLGNQYGKNGRMYAGVSKSTWTGSEWSKPEKMVIDNDYNYSPKSDYFLNKNATALLMSVERDDSFGDRDLYVSFYDETMNTWSQPTNLGAGINTATEESSPFLSPDGKTLYFSSAGYSGYGGADIYVSKRQDESWTNWTEPENLGAAINTPGNDIYFNMPVGGEHIYFTRSSNEKNADVFRLRKDDFYVSEKRPTLLAKVDSKKETRPKVTKPKVESKPEKTEPKSVAKEAKPLSATTIKKEVKPLSKPSDFFVTIEGKVINSKTNEPIGAEVVVERLPDGMKLGDSRADLRGEYQVKLRGGARYGLLANMNGFIAENENFDFNRLKKDKTIKKNIYMVPIEVGGMVTLNNIFFDFDESILKTSSYSELERVLSLMKQGEIEKMEIQGHTDAVGSEDYNLYLSQQRADAVAAFLTKNGIESSRVISKGYGESVPSYPNDSPEHKQKTEGLNSRFYKN